MNVVTGLYMYMYQRHNSLWLNGSYLVVATPTVYVRTDYRYILIFTTDNFNSTHYCYCCQHFHYCDSYWSPIFLDCIFESLVGIFVLQKLVFTDMSNISLCCTKGCIRYFVAFCTLTKCKEHVYGQVYAWCLVSYSVIQLLNSELPMKGFIQHFLFLGASQWEDNHQIKGYLYCSE